MSSLNIKYASGFTAAFTINSQLYYIKTGPDFPKLYDENLKKLIIPNMDSWLQANTRQRFSYQTLTDMIKAFSDGLEHNYTKDDIVRICNHVFDLSRDYIFKTEYAKDYASIFKIELMDSRQIKKLIRQIKENFQKFCDKYGKEKFHLFLCRLWKFCNLNDLNSSIIVEGFITRLGKVVQDPIYPTVNNEADIKQKIVNNIVGSGHAKFKGINDVIINNVRFVEDAP